MEELLNEDGSSIWWIFFWFMEYSPYMNPCKCCSHINMTPFVSMFQRPTYPGFWLFWFFGCLRSSESTFSDMAATIHPTIHHPPSTWLPGFAPAKPSRSGVIRVNLFTRKKRKTPSGFPSGWLYGDCLPHNQSKKVIKRPTVISHFGWLFRETAKSSRNFSWNYGPKRRKAVVVSFLCPWTDPWEWLKLIIKILTYIHELTCMVDLVANANGCVFFFLVAWILHCWNLGGGFKYLFIFTPDPWGNDPIWRAYFFKGVETTNQDLLRKTWSQKRICQVFESDQKSTVGDFGIRFLKFQQLKVVRIIFCRCSKHILYL